MLLNGFEKTLRLPLLAHISAVVASLFWVQWASTKLEASYVASGHPADVFTGQTSFNAETIKGYYAAMSETQTLDVYIRTQLIDFGFILGVALIGILVCTLIARMARQDSWGRKIGLIAGLAFVTGALSDAIENGWSFIMLANPSDFAGWLALPYSSFAMIKFGLMTLGMVLLIACILLAIAGRLFGKPKLG